MVASKQTEASFSEKPGIGSLSSLIIGEKALIASGAFDHRIRLSSVKTLKQLVTLSFHQGIVNNVVLVPCQSQTLESGLIGAKS